MLAVNSQTLEHNICPSTIKLHFNLHAEETNVILDTSWDTRWRRKVVETRWKETRKSWPVFLSSGRCH